MAIKITTSPNGRIKSDLAKIRDRIGLAEKDLADLRDEESRLSIALDVLKQYGPDLFDSPAASKKMTTKAVILSLLSVNEALPMQVIKERVKKAGHVVNENSYGGTLAQLVKEHKAVKEGKGYRLNGEAQ